MSNITTEEILEAFEKTRERDCTCRPKVKNGVELYIGAQETYGCVLHCGHYGIADGGICQCGWGEEEEKIEHNDRYS